MAETLWCFCLIARSQINSPRYKSIDGEAWTGNLVIERSDSSKSINKSINQSICTKIASPTCTLPQPHSTLHRRHQLDFSPIFSTFNRTVRAQYRKKKKKLLPPNAKWVSIIHNMHVSYDPDGMLFTSANCHLSIHALH